VDLLSIFVDFRGSSVDFRRFSPIFVDFRQFSSIFVDFRQFSSISVDFCRFSSISVDFRRANYVIGLARFSGAGLRSNEVLFFGFFPFAIIFCRVSVDSWIFGGFGSWVDFGGFAAIESSSRHGLAQFTSIGTLFLPSIFGPKLKKEWPK
jgi:hypothetical protein